MSNEQIAPEVVDPGVKKRKRKSKGNSKTAQVTAADFLKDFGKFRMLKVAEVATILSCNANTVRKLTREGRLHGELGLGHGYRYSPKDVNDLLESMGSGRVLPEG